MKKVLVILTTSLLFFISLVIIPTSVEARTRVRGYVKPKTYRYVQPHYRTSPNKSRYDNWSTRGNMNPYTGKLGTKNPYNNYSFPRY